MMIYKGMEIYNVSERIEEQNGAVSFLRVPKKVDDALGEQGKRVNRGVTGVEFRFVINSGEVKITLRTKTPGTTGKLTVVHGEFVADWPHTDKVFTEEATEITIVESERMSGLEILAKRHDHRFSPHLVRLICEAGGPFELLDVQGDISLPTPELLPKRKYLAYGSSITHGSIGMTHVNSYVSRVAEFFGADGRNLGFAGACCIEKEMADFIADECEFDFATFEMGINILGMDPAEFEKRVRYILDRNAKAHPNSVIFAIDVYFCHCDMDENDARPGTFRSIVRRVTEELGYPNIFYINGLDVLPDGEYLTDGLCHPAPRAIEKMAENLCRKMAKHL